MKSRNNLINLGIYSNVGKANGLYITQSRINNFYWSKDIYTPNVLSQDKYYLITALYNGTNRKIYVNGIEQASDSVTPDTVLGNITIGDQIPGQDGFPNIKVYSVRIYNRGLTPQEISKNYNIDKVRYGI